MKHILVILGIFIGLNTLSQNASAQQSEPERVDARYVALLQLQHEHEQIRLAGPRAGLVVSSLSLVTGPMMIGAGSFVNLFEEDDSTEGGGLIAMGAIITFVGTAGIIASAVRLKKAKDRRRELQREINALMQQGVFTSLPPPEAPAVLHF